MILLCESKRMLCLERNDACFVCSTIRYQVTQGWLYRLHNKLIIKVTIQTLDTKDKQQQLLISIHILVCKSILDRDEAPKIVAIHLETWMVISSEQHFMNIMNIQIGESLERVTSRHTHTTSNNKESYLYIKYLSRQ